MIKTDKTGTSIKENVFPIRLEEVYESKSGKGFKRIFKNFSFLTFGKIGGDLFNFILFVILTRVYGQEGIGQYSFAIGFTSFFATLSQFGLNDYTIKEISRNRNSFNDYFRKIFGLNLFLSTSLTLVLLLIIPFLSFSYETKLILAIVGVYQILVCIIDVLTTVFIAYEKMFIAGIISIMTRVVTAVGSIIIALTGGTILLSLFFLPVMSVVQLLIVLVLIKKIFGKVGIAKSFISLKNTFNEVLVFGFADILYQIYSRIDVVLIGFILGEIASGIYYIGYRLIFFLLFIPNFASLSIFPIIPTLFKQSKLEFTKMYNKSLNMMIIIGIPISVGIWIIAPQIIELIFGPKFLQSALILRILAGVFILKCLSSIMSVFLISSDNQKFVALSNLIMTIFSLITFPILIIYFKIEGAAVGIIFSSTLLVILFIYKLKPIIGLPGIGSRVLISLLGVMIFSIVFSLTELPLYFIIAGSVLIYIGTLLFFKTIRENELRMLLGLLKKNNINSLQH